MTAPQIKIEPQRELIVDEQSKNLDKLEKSEVLNGDFETGSGFIKKRNIQKIGVSMKHFNFIKL